MRAATNLGSRPRSKLRHFGGLATVWIALAKGSAYGAAGEPGSGNSYWRCPERDGVNCLYIQLRLLGYKGTYEQLVAAVPEGPERASLGGLHQAARRLGFELTPAELNIAELSSLRSPVVILLEEMGLDRGRFHLLVELSPSEAHLVDGSLISRGERKPIDQFRRGWTGFALVPKSRSSWLGFELGSMLGAATTLGVWTAYRCTQKVGTRAV